MNRTSYIIIGVTFVICATFGYFFTYSQVKSAYQTFKDTAQVKKNLDEVSQKKTLLDALSKNNQLNTLYDIASKYIPTQPDSSQLILELSAIAAANNLKVEQFSLETTPTAPAATNTTTTDKKTTTATAAPTTPTDNIAELPFKMKVSGSFTDFFTFLNNVQTCSRLVTITAMNLIQDTAGFTSQMSGKAYYKKATSLDQTLANINIPQDIINRFQNLKTYGTPIDLPTEQGFGRTNPFDSVP